MISTAADLESAAPRDSGHSSIASVEDVAHLKAKLLPEDATVTHVRAVAEMAIDFIDSKALLSAFIKLDDIHSLGLAASSSVHHRVAEDHLATNGDDETINVADQRSVTSAPEALAAALRQVQIQEQRLSDHQLAAVQDERSVAAAQEELRTQQQVLEAAQGQMQIQEQRLRELRVLQARYDPPPYWNDVALQDRLCAELQSLCQAAAASEWKILGVRPVKRDVGRWRLFALVREQIREQLSKLNPALRRWTPPAPPSLPFMSLHEDHGIDGAANEMLLLCGTIPEVVRLIEEEGFDERVSHPNGYFGACCCFAQEFAKSAHYTRPDASQRRFMFVARVVLGCPKLEDASAATQSYRRAPAEHHSVVGICPHAALPLREFVVYDGNQALPEYVIEFSKA